jgi:hypothetical protein
MVCRRHDSMQHVAMLHLGVSSSSMGAVAGGLSTVMLHTSLYFGFSMAFPSHAPLSSQQQREV